MCRSASIFHMHAQCQLICVFHHLLCPFPIDRDSRCLWGPLSPPLGLTLISASAGEGGSLLRLCIFLFLLQDLLWHTGALWTLVQTQSGSTGGAKSSGECQLETSCLVLQADDSGRHAGYSAFRS